MDALYVKQDGVLTKLDLGGGSSPGGVVNGKLDASVYEAEKKEAMQ